MTVHYIETGPILTPDKDNEPDLDSMVDWEADQPPKLPNGTVASVMIITSEALKNARNQRAWIESRLGVVLLPEFLDHITYRELGTLHGVMEKTWNAVTRRWAGKFLEEK